MVEISPSVELVTLPENIAEYFWSKVSGSRCRLRCRRRGQ